MYSLYFKIYANLYSLFLLLAHLIPKKICPSPNFQNKQILNYFCITYSCCINHLSNHFQLVNLFMIHYSISNKCLINKSIYIKVLQLDKEHIFLYFILNYKLIYQDNLQVFQLYNQYQFSTNNHGIISINLRKLVIINYWDEILNLILLIIICILFFKNKKIIK